MSSGGQSPAPGHEHFLLLVEKSVDGTLTPAEDAELGQHLAVCDECRETIEAERRLTENLRRLPRMVPPSDLRAQILRDAARERERMMSALEQGEKFRGVLVDPAERDEDADSPVFQAMPIRRRRRSAWRRHSPAVAAVFVGVAGLAALLTASAPAIQHSGLAGAVTDAAARLGELLLPAAIPGTSATTIARPAEDARYAQARSAITLAVPTMEDSSDRLSGYLRGAMTQVEAATKRLASAAASTLPRPAEASAPAVAALVLRPPVDGDFNSEELLRAVAFASASGGEPATLLPDDQFVFGGKRYKCYKVAVSPEWIAHMTRSLEGYKAPSEPPVLSVLAEQGHRLPLVEQVAFYRAPTHAFSEAALSPKATASGSAPLELQIYFVDP